MSGTMTITWLNKSVANTLKRAWLKLSVCICVCVFTARCCFFFSSSFIHSVCQKKNEIPWTLHYININVWVFALYIGNSKIICFWILFDHKPIPFRCSRSYVYNAIVYYFFLLNFTATNRWVHSIYMRSTICVFFSFVARS